MTEVARFAIEHAGFFLDPAGQPLAKQRSSADLEMLTASYRSIVGLRQSDARAVALQRTGRLGT